MVCSASGEYLVEFQKPPFEILTYKLAVGTPGYLSLQTHNK